MTGEEIQKVENRIKLLGIKKSHVAKNIDVTPTELSHFLSGNRSLRPEAETKLLNYLGLS